MLDNSNWPHAHLICLEVFVLSFIRPNDNRVWTVFISATNYDVNSRTNNFIWHVVKNVRISTWAFGRHIVPNRNRGNREHKISQLNQSNHFLKQTKQSIGKWQISRVSTNVCPNRSRRSCLPWFCLIRETIWSCPPVSTPPHTVKIFSFICILHKMVQIHVKSNSLSVCSVKHKFSANVNSIKLTCRHRICGTLVVAILH